MLQKYLHSKYTITLHKYIGKGIQQIIIKQLVNEKIYKSYYIKYIISYI